MPFFVSLYIKGACVTVYVGGICGQDKREGGGGRGIILDDYT